MLSVSDGLRDLRAEYSRALVTIASEIGSVDRSSAGAVALARVRKCLGAESNSPEVAVAEDEVRARLVEFVVSLRRVLQEFAPMDHSEENQQVVSELERDLGGLLA